MPVQHRRTRSHVIILGACFLITILLAMQAQSAITYHRMTALGVLRDYAALAAEQFRNRAQGRMAVEVNGLLADIRRTEPLAVPRREKQLLTPEFVFALDDATGVSSGIRSDGQAVSAGVMTAVEELVRPAMAQGEPSWYFHGLIGTMPDGPMVFFATEGERADGSKAIFGFGTRIGALAPLMAEVASTPLLPPTLTRGTPLDSGVAVRVSTSAIEGDSTPSLLFQSVNSDSRAPIRGDARLASMFPPLRVEMIIDESMADHLIIGGLPPSRLPFILALAGLTGVLLVVAMIQLRKEQDLTRRQADFVASVSHELRTPLAQLRMFSETLLLGRVRSREEEQRSLRILNQESRRLGHLVENLLHVARSNRRAVRIAPEPILLAPAIRDILEGFRPLAASRRITLTQECDEAAVGLVDRNALGQMLLNLLDNAVKYGPTGSTVWITAQRGEEGRVRIAVEDAGPGVPDKQRERIWDSFSRLDRDVESPVAGSGIGLAIVKELVTAHGGRCWVEGGKLGGARFVLEFQGHLKPLGPKAAGIRRAG